MHSFHVISFWLLFSLFSIASQKNSSVNWHWKPRHISRMTSKNPEAKIFLRYLDEGKNNFLSTVDLNSHSFCKCRTRFFHKNISYFHCSFSNGWNTQARKCRKVEDNEESSRIGRRRNSKNHRHSSESSKWCENSYFKPSGAQAIQRIKNPINQVTTTSLSMAQFEFENWCNCNNFNKTH